MRQAGIETVERRMWNHFWGAVRLACQADGWTVRIVRRFVVVPRGRILIGHTLLESILGMADWESEDVI